MDSTVLTSELRLLLAQVTELREETESIQCHCNDPDCPFSAERRESRTDLCVAEESPDLGFGSMEFIPYRKSKPTSHCSHPSSRYSLPYPIPQLQPPPATHRYPLARSCSSLTNIPRGVKRADGTILENDYPGFYSTGRRNRLRGGYSLTHLNQLGVNLSEEPEADCQVDQDGLMMSNHDYMFSRKAPERRLVRNVRREHHNSSPVQSSRRISDDALCMTRHSSAEVFRRHISVPSANEGAIARDPGLMDLIRLRNFQIKS